MAASQIPDPMTGRESRRDPYQGRKPLRSFSLPLPRVNHSFNTGIFCVRNDFRMSFISKAGYALTLFCNTLKLANKRQQ